MPRTSWPHQIPHSAISSNSAAGTQMTSHLSLHILTALLLRWQSKKYPLDSLPHSFKKFPYYEALENLIVHLVKVYVYRTPWLCFSCALHLLASGISFYSWISWAGMFIVAFIQGMAKCTIPTFMILCRDVLTWLQLLVHVQDWSLFMFKDGPKVSHGKERGNYEELL